MCPTCFSLSRTFEDDSVEGRRQAEACRTSGRGVRPTRLFELHDPAQSPFCRDESRPVNLDLEPKFGAQGRTQTFNLWFVGPALHQLSYSGENQFSFELRVSRSEFNQNTNSKLGTRNWKLRLVVGVGIEPTFRVFQSRANPSQLSDRNWTLVFGL